MTREQALLESIKGYSESLKQICITETAFFVVITFVLGLIADKVIFPNPLQLLGKTFGFFFIFSLCPVLVLITSLCGLALCGEAIQNLTNNLERGLFFMKAIKIMTSVSLGLFAISKLTLAMGLIIITIAETFLRYGKLLNIP